MSNIQVKELVYGIFRRHMSITICDAWYRLCLRIFHRESSCPHWMKIVDRGKKKIVLFECIDPGRGISSNSRQMMHLNKWCQKKGLQYVIYYNPEYKTIDDLSDEKNIWGKLFEQKQSINDLLNEEVNVLVVQPGFCPVMKSMRDKYEAYYDQPENPVLRDKKLLNELNRDNGCFLTPAESLRSWTEEFWSKNGLEGKKVLGVMMREDLSLFNRLEKDKSYNNEYFTNGSHPCIPNPQECCSIAKEKYNEWGCEAVIVATMFDDTIPLFEEAFGRENVFHINRKRYIFERQIENGFEFLEKEDMTQNEIDYMKEMILLSKCSSLIGAACGGQWLIGCIKSDEYEHLEYFPYIYPYGYNNVIKWEEVNK